MKAAEPTTSSVAKGQKATQPFFKREASFFAGSKAGSVDNFFSPSKPGYSIQPKLTIGQPNDKYEQEADAMADKVVQRLSNPETIQAKPISSPITPLIQTKCAACEQEEKLQKKEDDKEDLLKDKKLQCKPIFESNAELLDEKNSIQRKCAACERAEQLQTKAASTPTAPIHIESSLAAANGAGSPLPVNTKQQMEASFGVDFSNVRIHNNSAAVQMNKELNAHAFTHGSDIYFNEGKYNVSSKDGQQLLAHELTHVVQQNEGIKEKHIQRNLAQSMPTANGAFGIDMQTQTFATNGRTGLTGTIDFTPSVAAPYSNEIALIQIARVRDANTGNNVPPVGLAGTVGTNPLLTQENPATGVEGGFFTDVLHSQAGVFQDMPLSQGYRFSTVNQNAAGVCTGGNPQVHGFKRSNNPADIHEARLADCPGVQNNTSNLDFRFETVAKGTDTNVTYGSLVWEFKTRAGTVLDEHALSVNSQSATFNQAVARHQDFYTHESLVFYFDFNHDDLSVSEQAKLNAEVINYLSRFPDVRITISGFADRRGGAAFNIALANRRANTVAQLFMTAGGLSANRINPLRVTGSTEQFTNDAITDQDREANRRGNRRVTVEFEHTATVPLTGQI